MRARLALLMLAAAAALAPGSRFVAFRGARNGGARVAPQAAPTLRAAFAPIRAQLARGAAFAFRLGVVATLAAMLAACAPTTLPADYKPRRTCAQIMRRAGASPAALCNAAPLRVKRNGSRTPYTLERD